MGRVRFTLGRVVIAGVAALVVGGALAVLASSHHAYRAPSSVAGARATARPAQATGSGATTVPSGRTGPPAATASSPGTTSSAPGPVPLAAPSRLAPFPGTPGGGGSWAPAGRLVQGVPAVYETTLVPPGGTQPAGIAWMDTHLLSATLYSGSMSPGGGPYRYTAPVEPAQAASLVAVFNGGFQMNAAHGGYYTEGRVVDPLQAGAASLVIYRDGSVNIGAWGTDVTMTPDVVAVRQNLVPLVAGGSPTAAAATPNWLSWGATCGATSCTGPGIENQWRSGVGITADGALVYVTGPSLDPLQLAQLLAHAGAVRAMQLDINPYWTVFVTYAPTTPTGLADAANGQKLLAATTQGPATFFDPAWARDFITMSARPASTG